MDTFFESLGTTPSTVAVALVIFAVCVLIVRSEIKKCKNGGGSCAGCSGCSGSASGKTECPSCSIDVDALEKAVKKAEEGQRK